MKVCLLSFSPITDDPRIRRHADALSEGGHDVVVLGAPGRAQHHADWALREVPIPTPAPTFARRLRTGMNLMIARAGPRAAARAYWRFEHHQRLYEAAQDVRADVYHANDWPTLPVAARLAGEVGALCVYDTHEYAAEEFATSRLWRLTYRPLVRNVERGHIRHAEAVMTVGKEIADLLERDHGLPEPPIVVRNVPPYQEMPLRPPGDQVIVLYHGAFFPHRGLETLIESVALWRPEFMLHLRGSGSPDYEHALMELARSSGQAHRIRFLPPVEMSRLVEHANHADVGIFAIPPVSPQATLCLPNKFFEYVMGGLALCVSDLPEMSRLVRQFELGTLIRDWSPQGVAAAVNSLTSDRIAHYKSRALEAARSLSWQSEQATLLDLYKSLEADQAARPRS